MDATHPPPNKSTRDGFGQALLELGKKNPKVVVLSADLAESCRAHWFQKKYPHRYFEMGLGEQNMMGVAAGMALSGKIPFVTSFAVFCPGRNWEQLRISVALNNANVKIVGSHSGIMAGEDGPTHQALEDIALTKVLPYLTVIQPCDFWQAYKATIEAAKIKGPVYLRLTRPDTPAITNKNSPFKAGKAQILRKGGNITLIGSGPLLSEALIAAEILAKENISMEIINCHTIKPIDKKTILNSAKKTKKVITLEDHQISGGLGESIAEILATEGCPPLKLKMLGMKDRFAESGSWQELIKKYGLGAKSIIKTIRKF